MVCPLNRNLAPERWTRDVRPCCRNRSGWLREILRAAAGRGSSPMTRFRLEGVGCQHLVDRGVGLSTIRAARGRAMTPVQVGAR